MTWHDPASKPETARGFFLALDGPDGGGKSTQAATLAGWPRTHGFEVVTCRDPGEPRSAIGYARSSSIGARSTSRFGRKCFCTWRAGLQLVEEVIRPALARGQIVVSDRYLLANLVYQGYAGGLTLEEIGQVGLAATGQLLPDLTVVLDVPPELARRRVGEARDRIEDRPLAYHAKVREGFLQAARDSAGNTCSYYPAPVVVVDASADPEVVSSRIQSEVERGLALGPRS